MGASYGESGARVGLNRQQTILRNNLINAINSGDRNATRRATNAMRRAGLNPDDYVERRRRR